MRGFSPRSRRYHATARALRTVPPASSLASTLRTLAPGSTSRRTALVDGPGASYSCCSHSHAAAAAPQMSSSTRTSAPMRTLPASGRSWHSDTRGSRLVGNREVGHELSLQAARHRPRCNAHSIQLGNRPDADEGIGEEELFSRGKLGPLEPPLLGRDTEPCREVE